MTDTRGLHREGDERWVASSLGRDLSFLLARSNALSLANGNAALRAFGLKVRSYSILALVSDGLRPSQRDLADFLRLDPSQVVTLIDDLEHRGLVERLTDARDRRSKVVVPTADGRRVCAEAHDAVLAAEGRQFGAFSTREREMLAALLRRVAFPE